MPPPGGLSRWARLRSELPRARGASVCASSSLLVLRSETLTSCTSRLARCAPGASREEEQDEDVLGRRAMLLAWAEACFVAAPVRAAVAARRADDAIVEPVLLLLHATLMLLQQLADGDDERFLSCLLRGVTGRLVALLRVDLDDTEHGRWPADSLPALVGGVALAGVLLAASSAPGAAQAVVVGFVFATPIRARVACTAALFCFARKPGRNLIVACPDGEHENSATGWNDSVTGLPSARRWWSERRTAPKTRSASGRGLSAVAATLATFSLLLTAPPARVPPEHVSYFRSRCLAAKSAARKNRERPLPSSVNVPRDSMRTPRAAARRECSITRPTAPHIFVTEGSWHTLQLPGGSPPLPDACCRERAVHLRMSFDGTLFLRGVGGTIIDYHRLRQAAVGGGARLERSSTSPSSLLVVEEPPQSEHPRLGERVRYSIPVPLLLQNCPNCHFCGPRGRSNRSGDGRLHPPHLARLQSLNPLSVHKHAGWAHAATCIAEVSMACKGMIPTLVVLVQLLSQSQAQKVGSVSSERLTTRLRRTNLGTLASRYERGESEKDGRDAKEATEVPHSAECHLDGMWHWSCSFSETSLVVFCHGRSQPRIYAARCLFWIARFASKQRIRPI